MQIVIPMAGSGSRFPLQQFKKPKPLIDVNGKPMMIRAIESLGIEGDYFLAIREDTFELEIREELEKLQIPDRNIVSIKNLTEGPVAAILLRNSQILKTN